MNSKINYEPQQRFVFPFVREQGRWYIDFPEFLNQGLGCKADLEMVAGADVLIEALSEGKKCVHLAFANFEIENADAQLWKVEQDEIGATYRTNHSATELAWLCNVTKAVFDGFHPQRIWLQRAS